jgi:hypothetical protein
VGLGQAALDAVALLGLLEEHLGNFVGFVGGLVDYLGNLLSLPLPHHVHLGGRKLRVVGARGGLQ